MYHSVLYTEYNLIICIVGARIKAKTLAVEMFIAISTVALTILVIAHCHV